MRELNKIKDFCERDCTKKTRRDCMQKLCKNNMLHECDCTAQPRSWISLIFHNFGMPAF